MRISDWSSDVCSSDLIHWRVAMPHAMPGIASGCTLVFMLSAGALEAPQILGGPSSLWFTPITYRWFNTGGNWPQGAAYAIVPLAACLVFVLAITRRFKVSLGEDRKSVVWGKRVSGR